MSCEITNDQFLETLQSDIVAILDATPSLATICVIKEDDGDMDSRIEKAIGTGKARGGKMGCVAVVMLPEAFEAEPNLPGPPLNVRCKVQVIEKTIHNRGGQGTHIRTSAGALRVIQALHHHGLATHSLHAAASNPIEPVTVPAGYLSHMVTIIARFNGLQSPGRPGAVTGQMIDGDLALTCDTAEADIYYSTDGTYPTPTNGTLYADPIENLATGTTVRAAAYAEGLLPGPLTEIDITE